MPRTLNPIRIRWSVKGYHRYRVKPAPEVLLELVPEPNNPYDRHAIRVVIPDPVPVPMQNIMCETRNGRQPLHRLAGHTVGHVPANLCKALGQLRERGYLQGPVTARARGLARQSENPPVHARYERGARGGMRDQPGGC